MPSIRVPKCENSGFYFLTFTIKDWIYLFDRCGRWQILANSLNFCRKHKRLKVYCYVFMINHIHLIIYSPDVAGFIRDFKKFTSSAFFKEVQKDNNKILLQRLKSNSIGGKWKLWMDRFDSQIVLSEKFFKQKINYIHNNPVKAGLVEDITEWKYSSARNYYLEDNSVLEVSKSFDWIKE